MITYQHFLQRGVPPVTHPPPVVSGWVIVFSASLDLSIWRGGMYSYQNGGIIRISNMGK